MSKKLYHEFVLTKRHGRIMSREVYKFKWSPEALAAREALHKTVAPKVNLPKPLLPKLSKEDRFEKLPYSNYHYELVASLYVNDRESRILQQQTFDAAHELKIKQLAEKIHNKKLSLKEKRQQRRRKRLVFIKTTQKHFAPLQSAA